MNTKQAFDDAASGHEVIVSRGKQLFQLISLVDLPLGGNSYESRPGKSPGPILPLKPSYKPMPETEPHITFPRNKKKL